MKGASANSAAPRLKAETARIEELARARRTDEIPRRLGRLKQEWSLFVASAASRELCSGALA
jgi:HPt (histidine-containing phosphotransfer) domain-containing protein